MTYTVFKREELAWEPRGDDSGREITRLSDAMTNARANIWRYPAGAKGRRHIDPVQEETFVVLEGTPSMHLGDPPERADLTPGSVVVVQPGTALQIHNDSESDALLFIVGAPPEQGQADYLPDAV
jgi:mannose-6-phosphate isomerase-like protein (cupin superfamily)